GSGLSSASSVGIELDLGSGASVAVFAARVRLGKRYPRMSTDRDGRLADDERVARAHSLCLIGLGVIARQFIVRRINRLASLVWHLTGVEDACSERSFVPHAIDFQKSIP